MELKVDKDKSKIKSSERHKDPHSSKEKKLTLYGISISILGVVGSIISIFVSEAVMQRLTLNHEFSAYIYIITDVTFGFIIVLLFAIISVAIYHMQEEYKVAIALIHDHEKNEFEAIDQDITILLEGDNVIRS